MPLPPEAYAVVEGRHPDPFHYLGRHTETDGAVVRVFLPEAADVAVIDETGRVSSLRRIHEAGLFAGPLLNGSSRYHVRARYGEQVVEIEIPIGFRRCYRISIFICSARARICAFTTSSAGTRSCSMASPGSASWCSPPMRRRVSVVGDFNSWDGRRHAMRVRGNGFWEIFVPAARAGDKNTNTRSSGRMAPCCRSNRFRSAFARGAAAADRFDRRRPGCAAAPAAGAGRGQRLERSHIDL